MKIELTHEEVTRAVALYIIHTCGLSPDIEDIKLNSQYSVYIATWEPKKKDVLESTTEETAETIDE